MLRVICFNLGPSFDRKPLPWMILMLPNPRFRATVMNFNSSALAVCKSMLCRSNWSAGLKWPRLSFCMVFKRTPFLRWEVTGSPCRFDWSVPGSSQIDCSKSSLSSGGMIFTAFRRGSEAALFGDLSGVTPSTAWRNSCSSLSWPEDSRVFLFTTTVPLKYSAPRGLRLIAGNCDNCNE